MGCITRKTQKQIFPSNNDLTANLNFTLKALKQRIGNNDSLIYTYVLNTVENKNGSFIQLGSAPNFQGNYVTLCTCKRLMRCYQSKDSWPGMWIAGFSSIKAGLGRQSLFYLMKIKYAFRSHFELWSTKLIPQKTKQAKDATEYIRGDLYKPESYLTEEFNPQHYVIPHNDHVHSQDNLWHEDIFYNDRYKRISYLLVGDPRYSFLWNQPKLYALEKQYQGSKKTTLNQFLCEWLTTK